MVQKLCEQYRHNPEVRWVLEQRLEILMRCRSEGIDAGFGVLSRGPVPASAGVHDSKALFMEMQKLTRPEDMLRRVQVCREILAMVDRRSQPNLWAASHGMLADSLEKNPQGNPSDNQEQAIHHYQQALEVFTRETYPADWAMTHKNLAGALIEFIAGDRADNLEKAIYYCNKALMVYTRKDFPLAWASTQNVLGIAFYERLKGNRTENLKESVCHFGQALEIYTQEAYPAERRQTLRKLGSLYFKEGCWQESLSTYEGAIEAGNAVLGAASTETGRRAEVGETSLLFARMAYCLLRLGKPDQALLRLEQGKTRLLIEALVSSEADLGRRVPGFIPTVLEMPDLLKLIPAGGALVAPLVTAQGGAAFVLHHGLDQVTENQVILLEGLTREAAEALLVGNDRKPGWFRFYAKRGVGQGAPWQAAIELFTGQLWEMLMGQVHQRLIDLGLAPGAPGILMPQGGLGVLPLHASWREVDGGKRAFWDDYTVTYAPSGYALNISRGRLREEQRQEQSLLAVINPTRDLKYAAQEGEALAALFPQDSVLMFREDTATVVAFFQGAPGRSHVHYSGHGFYDWENFLQSGLLLASSVPFTLNEIITHLDLSSSRPVTLWPARRASPTFNSPPRTNT